MGIFRDRESGNYPGDSVYTVDVRSFSAKPKGLAKLVPTSLRAKFGSMHENYGSPFMTKSEAQQVLPSTVESARQNFDIRNRMDDNGKKPGSRIFFGRVVHDKVNCED